MAHARQSRPDSGLSSQVKVFDTFEAVSSPSHLVTDKTTHYSPVDTAFDHDSQGQIMALAFR